MVGARQVRWGGVEDDDLDLYVLLLCVAFDAGGNACKVIWCLPTDDFAVGSCMERVAGGEHGDGFEQIGLALGIVTREEEQPRTEGEIKMRVVAKVVEREVSEIYPNVRWRGGGRDSSRPDRLAIDV